MRESIRDIDRLRHMRNALVHGYITTNATLVWETYTTDLPVLKKQISLFIKELTNNVEP